MTSSATGQPARHAARVAHRVVDTRRMRMSPSVLRTRLDRISSYEDAREKARYALPRGLFDYVDGGSEGEYTMRRNVEAFEELVWRPKQAIYHERIDTSTEVLGVKL